MAGDLRGEGGKGQSVGLSERAGRSRAGRSRVGRAPVASLNAPICAELFGDEGGEGYARIWSRPCMRSGD